MIAITGSASGIGAAIRKRLEREGRTTVGVDLRDAEVRADLTTPAGRAAAVEGVLGAAGGRLDGVVACAGVGPQVEPTSTIVSLNYFGAVAVLDGLREALAAGSSPAAVAISSNSAGLPGNDNAVTAACLAGDEARAHRVAMTMHGHECYGGSKLALARWVRRNAPAWASAGIRLNAVAPGATQTPLLQAGLDHPIYGDAIRGFPIPTGGFGAAEDIAALVAYLLGREARFFCGSVIFCDGGSDAMLRPDAV